MAAKKKKVPQIIDGFSSVQAVKRSGKGAAPRTRASSTRLPAQPEPRASKSTEGEARIGHTAVPVTHELVCYQCDYAFKIRGHIHYTFCPKCKKQLDMGDHTVDGRLSIDVKTMGNIEVKPDAVLDNVTLVAQNIVLAGDARLATLQATRRLELRPGAKVDLKTVSARDFLVGPDMTFSTRRKLRCRQLEVGGTLRANVQAEEVAVLRATAAFSGELYCARLEVEDGARISAALYLGPNVQPSAKSSQNAA